MYREVPTSCPRCRVSIPPGEDASPRRCERCGGVWIDELRLLALLRERHPGRMLDELLEHNDGSERRDCGVCGEQMDLVWLETLAFDRCAVHGVWMEPGELERALAYDFPLDRVKPAKGERRT
jgi:Zn-finger nucleic acid-binding protein